MRVLAFGLIIMIPTITHPVLIGHLKRLATTPFGSESNKLRVCGAQYFELWEKFTPPPTGTESVSESPTTSKTQSRGHNVWAFAQAKLLEQAKQLLNIFNAPPSCFVALRDKCLKEAAENRITRLFSICPSAKPNATPNGQQVTIGGIGR
jgi:hypothetical protein